MTLKEKLKEFRKRFIIPKGHFGNGFENMEGGFWTRKELPNEVEQFISTTIQEALESLQGVEMFSDVYGDKMFRDGWNAREKKLREDVSKFLNN